MKPKSEKQIKDVFEQLRLEAGVSVSEFREMTINQIIQLRFEKQMETVRRIQQIQHRRQLGFGWL